MIKDNKTNNKKLTKTGATRLIIIAVFVALIITIIVQGIKLKNAKGDELQEIATKKYFESGFVSVSELYMKAGKADVDEVQFMQAALKSALDQWFATNGGETVEGSQIMGMISNPYNFNVDFNGLLVSGYEYSLENDTFRKVDGANSNLGNIEANTNMTISNYDGQKIMVNDIKKTGKNTYKLFANIVRDSGQPGDEANIEAKSEINVKIENNEIVLESAEISDVAKK